MLTLPWYKRSSFTVGISILIIGGILSLVGVLSLYPPEGTNNPLIVLMREVPESFWTSIGRTKNSYFHIIHSPQF